MRAVPKKRGNVMLMRFTLLIALAVLSSTAAYAAIKEPGPGNGLVVIELIQPELLQYKIAEKTLLDGKKGDKYRANPDKLEAKATENWKLANRIDYGLLIGKRQADADEYDVVEGEWIYTQAAGPVIDSSLSLYKDEVSGKIFYVGEVPAGEAVIYGLNLQALWQLRFDAGAPHFTVPEGGYVFLGRFNGVLNRQLVVRALETGVLPRSTRSAVAKCHDVIENFEPADANDSSFSDAGVFLEHKLGKAIQLSAAAIDIRPFVIKVNGGFLKSAPYFCANG